MHDNGGDAIETIDDCEEPRTVGLLLRISGVPVLRKQFSGHETPEDLMVSEGDLPGEFEGIDRRECRMEGHILSDLHLGLDRKHTVHWRDVGVGSVTD